MVELPYYILDPEKVPEGGLGSDFRITVYGAYPCDWNGGRKFISRDAEAMFYDDGGFQKPLVSVELPEDVLRSYAQRRVVESMRYFNDMGIPFFVTMSNLYPQAGDKMEEIADFLDELSSVDGNGVIVAHPEIHARIKDSYGPSLKYISSVIRFYADSDFSYGKAFKDFDFVVLKPEDVLTSGGQVNGRFFKALSSEQKSRSIIISTHPCSRDCAYSRNHYMNTSIDQKHDGDSLSYLQLPVSCNKTRELELSADDVNELQHLGMSNFKIGRSRGAQEITMGLFPQVGSLLISRTLL